MVVPTVEAESTPFDTVDLSVYDAPSFALGDSTMAGTPKKNESEAPLKGLYGWLAERLGVPPWAQILIFVLALEAGAAFYWHSGVETHLGKIDSDIQLMPLQISRDLLAQANADLTLGKPARAATATEAASSLVSQVSLKRIPAHPDYFADVVTNLDMLTSHSPTAEFLAKVNTARTVLAGYRSAIAPIPSLADNKKTLDQSFGVTYASTIDPSTFGHATVLNAAPGVEFFTSPFIRRLADRISIRDLTFNRGAQTLDGFHWGNVTFLNTLIKYEGGELELNNVQFVDCTFEIADGSRGARFANAVALGVSSLTIGPQ